MADFPNVYPETKEKLMSDNTSEPQSQASANLSTSSRTGLGRWLELVCDGDEDAVQAALDAVGELEEVEDLPGLLEAVGVRHALAADLKDDESLEWMLGEMREQRGLDGFEAPAEPPAGAARCTAVLQAFADWVAQHGYVAVPLGDGDWYAVLVRRAHYDELVTLSGALGIEVQDPRQAWAD
jgi:hypothetical protein